MSPFWQYAIVFAVLLWCLRRLALKFAPAASWRWQAKLSYFLESRNAGTMKKLGCALRPPITATQAACGSGCSACKVCQ